MASPLPNNMPINPDTTMVTVKVAIDGTNRRFKLALRDLGANVFPAKLRFLLAIPPTAQVSFERYSDSAGSYVTLDSSNPAIYKQLYRAAKAKLKLRIRATVTEHPAKVSEPQNNGDLQETKDTESMTARPRSKYLETVLAPTSPLADLRVSHVLGQLQNPTVETLVEPAKDQVTNLVPLKEKESSVPMLHSFATGVYCIDCNNCGRSIPNDHYHCSTCDGGDFDLCMACVNWGVSCGSDDHWLIKRTFKNGEVVSSVTETIPPKKLTSEDTQADLVAPLLLPARHHIVERTCNSCIAELPNSEFVSCCDCGDFDLCKACLLIDQHGHNPSHLFVALEDTLDASLVNMLCKPGRNVPHMAICDGCDKAITGVRHKCLNCPDWDYCSDCVGDAGSKHPGHRFAPLYEPIAEVRNEAEVHYGIYCDGPLCYEKRSYIRGVRYKCAVCHDTDFCANCEAAPTHQHNRTHPLIKFKTPVKHVSITTMGEKLNGERMEPMGDRIPSISTASLCKHTRCPSVKTASTETMSTAKLTNAATQVQTMADLKPIPSEQVSREEAQPLDARFVTDSVPDGTVLAPNTTFTQTWTMTNPGPAEWPAGSSVRFTGGDWMLNVDTKHPSSVSAIYAATESSVLKAPVASGEGFTFEVVLKTPSKQGRAISYWRLKTPAGVAFGHKLWCDVTVRASDEQEIKPASSYVAPSVKEEQDEETAKTEESSTMIFPKLEKESPVASVHESTQPDRTTETPASERVVQPNVDDLLDDVESLGMEDEDDTEGGFLTDEEYDILDASDEEFLEAAQKAAQ